MTKNFIEEKIEEFREKTIGMDMDEVESNDGWWETSVGATFGRQKKDELENFLSQSLSEQSQKIEEVIRKQKIIIAQDSYGELNDIINRKELLLALKSEGIIK